MLNLHIATGWTAAKLNHQKKRWAEIKRISLSISQAADAGQWDEILDLSDEREQMISDFFTDSICKPLFLTVVQELEDIKLQHAATMQRISVQLERNMAREAMIKQQQQEISELKF